MTKESEEFVAHNYDALVASVADLACEKVDLETKLASATEVIRHYADRDNWICNPDPAEGCPTAVCPHNESLMLVGDDEHGYDKAAEWLERHGEVKR